MANPESDNYMPRPSLNFAALAAINVLRCEEVFGGHQDWSLNDWATALAGEVGEMCNLLKKRRRGEMILDEEIAKELADVILYADLLATHAGINLERAVVQKFNEVSFRRGSKLFLEMPG